MRDGNFGSLGNHMGFDEFLHIHMVNDDDWWLLSILEVEWIVFAQIGQLN